MADKRRLTRHTAPDRTSVLCRPPKAGTTIGEAVRCTQPDSQQQPGRRGVSVGVKASIATMDDAAVRDGPSVRALVDGRALVESSYDAYQRQLFSFALRATRDPGAAEDLVQEAFARLLVEVDAGRAPANVRAWLFRVIANLVVSGGRRATVARNRLDDLVRNGSEPGPEPAYLDREQHSLLDDALAELDLDARTALVMAADGFRGIEIADAIGRSPTATRTLMCRSTGSNGGTDRPRSMRSQRQSRPPPARSGDPAGAGEVTLAGTRLEVTDFRQSWGRGTD